MAGVLLTGVKILRKLRMRKPPKMPIATNRVWTSSLINRDMAVTCTFYQMMLPG